LSQGVLYQSEKVNMTVPAASGRSTAGNEVMLSPHSTQGRSQV
jgi:hypothetical protein